jgi:hypothetical protein
VADTYRTIELAGLEKTPRKRRSGVGARIPSRRAETQPEPLQDLAGPSHGSVSASIPGVSICVKAN